MRPARRRARRIVAVGGGKGGIGKSLVSANLGIALARAGHRVTLVDADLGGANLHTCLGISQPQGTLSDVVTHGTRIESLATADRHREPEPGLRSDGRAGCGQPARPGPGAAGGAAADARRRLPGAGPRAQAPRSTPSTSSSSPTTGVLVLLPEPTSVENAYRFLKAALFRRLQHTAQTLGRGPPRRGGAREPGQRDADPGRGGEGRGREPSGCGGPARAVTA